MESLLLSNVTTLVDAPVFGLPAWLSAASKVDVYSLGATLYHLATGRVLFPGLGNDDMMRAHCDETSRARDPRAYRPALSEGFAQMLEAMLVKNRDYRVSDWSGVIAMAREVENGSSFKPRDCPAASSSIRLIGQ